MKYDIQEHLKPRGLTGISEEQIEQHWHLYEAYVKNTNELLQEIETAEHGSRVWGELKRRLGFEFNGMVLHEYYFANLAAGAALSPGSELAAALTASALPGVRVYPVTFTPAAGAKLGGQVCQGVFLIVTDRDRLRPIRVGLQLASTLSRMYGQQFKLEDAAALFGSKSMLEKIRAGGDPAAIAASWAADEAKWRLTRAKYLLY